MDSEVVNSVIDDVVDDDDVDATVAVVDDDDDVVVVLVFIDAESHSPDWKGEASISLSTSCFASSSDMDSPKCKLFAQEVALPYKGSLPIGYPKYFKCTRIWCVRPVTGLHLTTLDFPSKLIRLKMVLHGLPSGCT